MSEPPPPGGPHPSRLRELADEIDGLAPARSTVDPPLRQLAQELRAGGYSLVGADLITAFPPDVLLPDERGHGAERGVRLLELLRDVLVFVPVLVTWWQLRYALQAYNSVVTADQREHTASVSFLLGWIRGFDHKTWPLSRAALVVATVIALVIALTLLAHFWRARVERTNSRAKDRAELGGLLAEGTLLLARVRRGGGNTFSHADIESMVRGFYENSDRLTSALREASSQIAESLESGPATRLENAINEWSASARELREVGQSLKVPTQVMDTLRELERSLAASALQLTNGVNSLVAQLADHTDAAGQEAAAHIGMAREVTGMTAEVISAFDTFARRLEQLGNLVDELRTVIDRARMSDAAEY